MRVRRCLVQRLLSLILILPRGHGQYCRIITFTKYYHKTALNCEGCYTFLLIVWLVYQYSGYVHLLSRVTNIITFCPKI